jgi:hypothetical protein
VFKIRRGHRRALVAAALVLGSLPALASTPASAEAEDAPGTFSYLRSSDGGAHFATRLELDDIGATVGSTHVVVENAVTHAIFDTGEPDQPRRVFYRRAVGDGAAFEKSVRLDVTNERGDPANGDSSETDLAADGDRIAVVWEDDRLVDGEPDPCCDGDVDGEFRTDEVFYAGSGNGGDSFSVPVNLSDSPDVHNTDPVVAVRGGLLAVAYEGRDADGKGDVAIPPTEARDLYFRASTDAGTSFGPVVAVTPMAPGDQDEASVAIDEAGTVHIAYQDVQFVDETEDYDEELNRIGYVRSPDAGLTFSEPVLLPGDHQASAPAVLVVGDTVHVVACDDRNEDDPADTADLLYWRGTDDGVTTTFGSPAVLARPEFKCDKPAIDGVGTDLHVAVGVEDGGLEADVWYFRSDNGGDGFDGPRNLSDNLLESIDPSVSVNPADSADVHISWTDHTVFLFASNNGLLPLEEGGFQEIANEDVVQYTGGAYRKILDGSDVGLQPFRIDALARLSDSEFVLSFTEPGPVPGVGAVDDSDLVLFTADSLGEQTSGTFSLWFDGSDVDLLEASEDIDAAEVVVNSDPETGETTTVDLYFSTSGAFTTKDGTTGKDEDVVACRGLTTGPESACATIDVAFDGSGKGLDGPGEDINAFSFDGVGPGVDDEKFVSYYSTAGDFSIPTGSGARSDLLQCLHPKAEPAAENPLGECGGSDVPLLKAFDGMINVLGGDLTAVEVPYKV